MVMKKTLLIAGILTINQWLSAQDYFPGKLTDEKAVVSSIYYDRTQYAVSNTVHQTQYKVADANKKNLYTIFMTHDKDKSSITISVSVGGSDTKGNVIKYDVQKCGLIFSNVGSIDTVFPVIPSYTYLLSFTDTNRDYPVLHALKTADQKELELDPLSRLRIKKHNELVRKFYPQLQITKVPNYGKDMEPKASDNLAKVEQIAKESSVTYSLMNDNFNTQLFVLRDSLYAQNGHMIELINKMRNEMEYEISMYMKNAHVYGDEERYGGEEKNGLPEGKGVWVYNGNIYDGTFAKGLFQYGRSMIKTKTSTYYGENTRDSMNGKGWLKYTNGSFLLGEFRNGKLANGISLAKENGEVFFGNYVNGQRTGYGELRNSRGDSYYGEFLNGRLIKGYCKEVDQFGYSTYSRVESGTKSTVTTQIAEAFFDTVHNIKEKAETQP